MEIFQTDIRHMVLRIKTNEEKHKKCKEELANLYRTMQNNPTSNVSMKSDFNSFTKQVLIKLKETDEQNKTLRVTLREVLIKISEKKFLTPKKTDVIPSANMKGLSSENPFQIPDIQRSHHAGGHSHHISSEREINTQTQEVQAQDFGDSATATAQPQPQSTGFTRQRVLVNFKNVLNKKFSTFTEKGIIIRMSIGPMESDENVQVDKPTFFSISLQHPKIPEWKKTKCKIKR